MYTYVITYTHTKISTVEVFAKSIKEKELRSKELLAESSAHSALEVTPCQKVLRIDKLQSVKEVTFYRK
jgi:peroxiredoxin family protein